MKEIIAFLKENKKEIGECKCEASGGSSEPIILYASGRCLYHSEDDDLGVTKLELSQMYQKRIMINYDGKYYNPIIYESDYAQDNGGDAGVSWVGALKTIDDDGKILTFISNPINW